MQVSDVISSIGKSPLTKKVSKWSKKHKKWLVTGAVFAGLTVGFGTYNPAITYSYVQEDVEFAPGSKLERILTTMDENDTLKLTVTSFGGYVTGMARIMDLMYYSKGHIDVKVVGYSMSAGTGIMFAGDTLEISPHSIIMYHGPSRGGRKTPLTGEVTKLFYKQVSMLGGKYLTVDEATRMLQGEDIFILGADFMARMSDPTWVKTDVWALYKEAVKKLDAKG